MVRAPGAKCLPAAVSGFSLRALRRWRVALPQKPRQPGALRPRWGSSLLLALALLATGAGPAMAHKLILFANADGATIHGKAYFLGGAPAQDLAVTAYDPQNAQLATATTDQQGEFSLTASFRCDHRLVVETSDGHAAEFTLRADQLAADLPPRGETTGSAPETHPSPGPAAHAEPADPARPKSDAGAAPCAELRALRADVAALQEQLTHFENQARLRDLLGGIGYILGLAGIAFFFLGARRKQSAEAADRETS